MSCQVNFGIVQLGLTGSRFQIKIDGWSPGGNILR
jgi:hypothetical protein